MQCTTVVEDCGNVVQLDNALTIVQTTYLVRMLISMHFDTACQTNNILRTLCERQLGLTKLLRLYCIEKNDFSSLNLHTLIP